MPVIGITGGIASGKSTFCKCLLAQMEASFFDADICARELLASDPEIQDAVRRRISPLAYQDSGELNRAALREWIFTDIEKRHTLESILHPAIRKRWLSAAEDARRNQHMLVIEIPLLFETHAEAFLDRTVVIACSEDEQMNRMTHLRGLSKNLARKILASQCTMALKIQKADHIIWNSSNGAHPHLLELQTGIFAAYLHGKYDKLS